MKNYRIIFKDNKSYKEVKHVVINNVVYGIKHFSDNVLTLLEMLAYDCYSDTFEDFDDLAQFLGYDVVLEGILKLRELGANIASAEIYRQLVMSSFKKEHKGLMRN